MTGNSFWFFANYANYERDLSSGMIGIAMLGMGASLTIRDFTGVLLVWKGVAVGMGIQFILVPIWACIVLVLLAQIPANISGLTAADSAGFALGIALIAAMPGGSTSNLLTFVGRGNVALSVTLTAFTTFLCLVTTPILVDYLISFQFPGTLVIDAWDIVLDIALFLVVPLLIGMVSGHLLKSFRVRFTSVMVKLSLLLLGIIIIGSLGAGRLNLPRYGWLGPVVVLVFCACIAIIVKYTTRLCGLNDRDGFTISIEATVKNVLLALLLITTMFPHVEIYAEAPAQRMIIEAARDGCTYVVLLFGGICLATGFVSLLQHRRERSS